MSLDPKYLEAKGGDLTTGPIADLKLGNISGASAYFDTITTSGGVTMVMVEVVDQVVAIKLTVMRCLEHLLLGIQ